MYPPLLNKQVKAFKDIYKFHVLGCKSTYFHLLSSTQLLLLNEIINVISQLLALLYFKTLPFVDYFTALA